MSKLYTNNTFSQKLYDGCEFAYQIQKAYFSKMKEFLRALGVKTPMSAAVSTEFLADLKSVADELDFTAENFYWDHPSFEEGKLWKDPYYYNNTNQLKDDSLITFMPFTSILKWKDKPLVIREWAVPWPNSYRGASILEVVSYGSLQDFDCLILFSYRANKDIDLLREFSFQADIPVWGLMGICAKIFLNEDIGKAKNKINLLYKKEDLFYPGSALNILYKLSWITQMENASLNGPVSEDSSIKFKKSGFDLKNLEIKDLVFKTFKNKYLENNIYLSDTKEIKKDLNQGKIEVNAPKVSAIAGDLSKETALGALKSNTITPFGTLMAVSLDNKNLNDSNYFLIKMTTLAENSNQLFYKDINSFYPQKYKLINRGNSPITTLGEPSQIPTTIFWKGRKIFEIFLKNGSFELIFDQDKWLFACDTPGIKVKIYPDFEKTKITAYFYDNLSSIFMNNNSEFNYPAYCKYLEITLLKKIKNTGGGPISPYILLNLLQEFNL
ncbi:MAG: hypothetical protein HYU63_01690 [Armatimonadetes bacterium]|nr:hypothetical protein [Armatimonadota bacterium]